MLFCKIMGIITIIIIIIIIICGRTVEIIGLASSIHKVRTVDVLGLSDDRLLTETFTSSFIALTDLARVCFSSCEF